MAKEVGKDRLGDLYTNGKVRKRREWRGFADTMYDYWRWLHIMGISSLRIKKQGEVKNFCRSHPAGPRRIGLAQSSGKSTLPTKE